MDPQQQLPKLLPLGSHLSNIVISAVVRRPPLHPHGHPVDVPEEHHQRRRGRQEHSIPPHRPRYRRQRNVQPPQPEPLCDLGSPHDGVRQRPPRRRREHESRVRHEPRRLEEVIRRGEHAQRDRCELDHQEGSDGTARRRVVPQYVPYLSGDEGEERDDGRREEGVGRDGVPEGLDGVQPPLRVADVPGPLLADVGLVGAPRLGCAGSIEEVLADVVED
mmetsp:Transcript_53885/g.161221  ORF Transcript_53885/g.161221 Transcript_53885/m.161221 type:complete len:219 (-) Transcript_53885:466-1122(-)